MPLHIHDTMACVGESSRDRIERDLLEEAFFMDHQGDDDDVEDGGVAAELNIEQSERVLYKFLPELGPDIVLASLWPRLMDGPNKVANFQTCCLIRTICVEWKDFVEHRPEWQKGLLSWAAGNHRFAQEVAPSCTEPESENDSEDTGSDDDEQLYPLDQNILESPGIDLNAFFVDRYKAP